MYMLYIDPGTGSMLFSILIGIMATLLFFLQNIFIKLKFLFAAGKGVAVDTEKIPYMIFSDSKRYWNVFKPVCDEFEKRKLPLKYYTMSEDDPALEKTYEYVECEFLGEGNKAFAKLNLMSANICLSTTPGLEVYQWKRSQNIDWYVHIYHGIDEGTVYRMFALDFYDAVLLTGAFQERYIRILEEQRNLKEKETYVTGSTYIDALCEKTCPWLQQEKKDDILVLLAPSWGSSGILNVYGEKIIDALLETGYDIVIRPHPQSMVSERKMILNLQEKYKNSEQLSWNYDNDNFDILSKTDIMITDFSGIIFDFSLVFDKPVIYTHAEFDDAPYDACWIKERLWRFTALEKLGIELREEDFFQLKDIIYNLLNNEKYQEGRRQISDEAWQYKGLSAERTVDYLQRKYEQLTNEKGIVD